MKDNEIAANLETAERQRELKMQLLQWRYAKQRREDALNARLLRYQRGQVPEIDKQVALLSRLTKEVPRRSARERATTGGKSASALL